MVILVFRAGFLTTFLAEFCQKLAKISVVANFCMLIYEEGMNSNTTWKFESNRIKNDVFMDIFVLNYRKYLTSTFLAMPIYGNHLPAVLNLHTIFWYTNSHRIFIFYPIWFKFSGFAAIRPFLWIINKKIA